MRQSPHCHWRSQVHYTWFLIMKKAGRFLMSRSTFPGTRGRDISFLSPSSEAPSHAITPFGLSIFHLLKPYFWFFQCPNNYPDYWKPFQAMVQVMSLPLSILSYFPDFSACGFFFFKLSVGFFSQRVKMDCVVPYVFIIMFVLEIPS